MLLPATVPVNEKYSTPSVVAATPTAWSVLLVAGTWTANRGVNRFRSAPTAVTPPPFKRSDQSMTEIWPAKNVKASKHVAPAAIENMLLAKPTLSVDVPGAGKSGSLSSKVRKWTSQSPVGSAVSEIAKSMYPFPKLAPADVSQSQLTSVASQRPWRLS